MDYRYSTSRTSCQGSTSSDFAGITSSRNNSTSTQSSYYSASNLSPTNQYRTLHAASARAQVATAPSRRPRNDYPKLYENREKIASQGMPPYSEYPIMSAKNSNWKQEKYNLGHAAQAGPLRAIYNNSDRSAFDIAYHNRKLGHDGKNFERASYRPRVPGSSSVAAALATQRDREEGWTTVSRR
ncbi:hypothetical protein LTR95_010379 [Oleoguttula sp. CCFEE 5521]